MQDLKFLHLSDMKDYADQEKQNKCIKKFFMDIKHGLIYYRRNHLGNETQDSQLPFNYQNCRHTLPCHALSTAIESEKHSTDTEAGRFQAVHLKICIVTLYKLMLPEILGCTVRRHCILSKIFIQLFSFIKKLAIFKIFVVNF